MNIWGGQLESDLIRIIFLKGHPIFNVEKLEGTMDAGRLTGRFCQIDLMGGQVSVPKCFQYRMKGINFHLRYFTGKVERT